MNSHLTRRIAFLGLAALTLVLLAAPAAGQLIPFQGRLTDGTGQPLEGVFRVTFTIYDTETGGTPLQDWIETHENVSVIAGQINVLLGSITSLDGVSFASSEGPRYLGIKIGEDSNQEMVPRHQLVPAFHARFADKVAPRSITSEELADGAVTNEKLAPNAGTPVGAVIMWWGSQGAIPEGFELCDGTTVTTTGSPLLGTAKPDLRDRVPLGVGSTVAPSLGFTGGSAATEVGATALSIGQMPSHTLGGAGGHNHSVFADDNTPSNGGSVFNTDTPDNFLNGKCIDVANGTPGGGGFFGFQGRRFAMGASFTGNPLTYSNRGESCPDQTTSSVGNHTHPAVGGNQTHTHDRELTPFVGMNFIIRVK